jgi:hypothetical protein
MEPAVADLFVIATSTTTRDPTMALERAQATLARSR